MKDKKKEGKKENKQVIKTIGNKVCKYIRNHVSK